mmetsp:Transcript_12628/g.39758  ORF Transcript_12628/g.39758 Transcript_12628/m.39758 type:complete len:248 (+) Transcript_12628:398-1141(+)
MSGAMPDERISLIVSRASTDLSHATAAPTSAFHTNVFTPSADASAARNTAIALAHSPARPHAAMISVNETESGSRPRPAIPSKSCSASSNWPLSLHALIAVFTLTTSGCTCRSLSILSKNSRQASHLSARLYVSSMVLRVTMLGRASSGAESICARSCSACSMSPRLAHDPIAMLKVSVVGCRPKSGIICNTCRAERASPSPRRSHARRSAAMCDWSTASPAAFICSSSRIASSYRPRSAHARITTA